MSHFLKEVTVNKFKKIRLTSSLWAGAFELLYFKEVAKVETRSANLNQIDKHVNTQLVASLVG